MIDPSEDVTKVQHGEPGSITGVTYRDMSDGGYYRNRNDSKPAVSEAGHLSTGDSH